MTDPVPNAGLKTIKKLIITSPYEEPVKHWRLNPDIGGYEPRPGRRSAGYIKATKGSKRGSDAGLFEVIPHINRIRKNVSEWRQGGYSGATHTTRQLLRRWHDNSLRRPDSRFFYCQMEAIETAIWAHEIGRNDPLIRNLDGDGGPFKRLCCKMATGTGKTVVMAMLIAWQVLNAFNDRNGGFTRNILIVAPSISVRRRLAILKPSNPHNYYEKFAIVDRTGLEKLNRARITLHNWHILMNAAVQKKPAGQASHVMLDIPVSNAKFSKDVLGHVSRNVLVINDEAHHAWRPMETDEKLKGRDMKNEKERATRWIEGLDKINLDRNIIACYDFSATPFRPTGHSVSETERFKWIISDFSLEDAIESGLIKTSRTPKYDDSGTYAKEGMSKFQHIFPHVKGDFKMNRHAKDPLPQLAIDAYDILGATWKKTHAEWVGEGYGIPPVMVTVCNNTKSSERIVHHFNSNKNQFKDLVRGMEKIDSVAIDNEDDGSDGDSSDLRTKIDTVGRVGEPGQDVTHVVSVNMLTEGWDAHNVTHIMGLRAFESQLLCEQVVGRGPAPQLVRGGQCDRAPAPGTRGCLWNTLCFHAPRGLGGKGRVRPSRDCRIPGRLQGSMRDWVAKRVGQDGACRQASGELGRACREMEVDGRGLASSITVAPSLDGKHIGKGTELKVEGSRLQEFVFRVSSNLYSELDLGTADPYKVAGLIRAVNSYVGSGRIKVAGVSRIDREKYVRALKANMNDIVRHVADFIKYERTENTYFKPDDPAHPTMSTMTMPRWYSRRKWLHDGDVSRCHLNVGVYDSELERDAMLELENYTEVVKAWVKNDQHLGFRVPYHHDGAWHDYYPDFLVRLEDGITAVIEMKGAEEEAASKKQKALDDWIRVVNADGRYGVWVNCGLVRDTARLKDVLAEKLLGSRQSEDLGGAKWETACPVCGIRASGSDEIRSAFGFRTTKGISRSQSWCRKCRTTRPHQNRKVG